MTALRRFVDAPAFQTAITSAILLAAVVVGIQTYPEAVDRWGPLLHAVDRLILWIFVGEAVLKMGAEGARPWRYFFDPWNVFDFSIVAVCFLPIGGQYLTVLRLARLLRVLKLVRALPRLQVLVTALLKSIPSMFYISILLSLLFYLYAVFGTFLFRANDPVHFPDLQTSVLTMYRVSTLEDWTDVMYTNMYGCDEYGYRDISERCTHPEAHGWSAALFFSSFTLLATMVILNLFIGVIMTGMEEAQKELADSNAVGEGARPGLVSLPLQLARLSAQLAEIQTELSELARRSDGTGRD